VSPRRRALVLGGLALVLGALAASDVAGREAALRRRLGPVVPVVVARRSVQTGARLRARDLAVRHVPARYAPTGAFAAIDQVAGLRAVAPLPAGADVAVAAVGEGRATPGPPVRRGERVADVVAVASAATVAPGSRVDVLVTRDARGDAPGSTVLALQDAEVLSAAPGPPADDTGAPRLTVGLRVTLRQAVFLDAAQAFAREVRVLPRAPGDHRRSPAGLAVDEDLAFTGG